jgi:Uma2 family endonuclease
VADYQRAGTRVVWLIDPESQCIVVYERGACRTLTLADHLTSERWLPGFSVRVADVFK